MHTDSAIASAAAGANANADSSTPGEPLNPLLAPWHTPHGLPPFAQIRAQHFAPAFDAAMAAHRREVELIATQAAPPDFLNTVAALDRAGALFHRVSGVFHNLTASETSPALQAVERAMAPKLAAHSSAVYMQPGLFARIDALHGQRAGLGLGSQDLRLLERFHLDFVRAGAAFSGAEQARYATLMQGLAALTTQFSQNVLADEAAYQLVLRSEAELAGLPPFVRAAARAAAVQRGLGDPQAHVITLSRSLIVPFLTFSTRRDLRETAWRAWTTRGEHPGAHDNRPVAQQILALRQQQARMHGQASYADYALADTMAGCREAVAELLLKAWQPAQARAGEERAALEAMALRHGERLPIEAWDWRFHAERVRQERYGLDEAQVKPYFALERMVAAAFDCAHRLFGLNFTLRPDYPVYHPDVRAYEVSRALAGGGEEPVGIFLHDNFARPSKRSGAWMSAYRRQRRDGGTRVLPIIVNNNNFAQAAAGEPTLLSFDDARTLFHEFGHGLHGLLSDVAHDRLSGTSVLRDFVELPSQLFEHWLGEPDVLKRHALHHATGEPIPDALVAQLKAAEHFNQGYETLRYTASALVDLAIHSLSDAEPPDIAAFEAAELQRLGLPAAVGVNHRLPHFQHLFAGSGYAAGYYVYLWAEVLGADGYDAFVEAGDPFDAAVAQRLLRNIYAAGNSVEPMAAYLAFRGRAPTVEPMLRGRGLSTIK